MVCEVLRLNLAKKTDLCALTERDCTSLRVDIENAQKATVDLWDRLESSKVAFNEETRCVDELTTDLAKRDQLHAAELVAKEKECRAKEEQKVEGLWRQIVALKIERMELRGRIGVRTEPHSMELQRAKELTASLAEQLRKHAVELADWAKKLTDCEAIKSLEVECRVRFKADCGWLHGRLKLITEQLEKSRARAEKVEVAYR